MVGGGLWLKFHPGGLVGLNPGLAVVVLIGAEGGLITCLAEKHNLVFFTYHYLFTSYTAVPLDQG